MPKTFLLIVLGVFVLFLGLFVLGDIPMIITSDEVSIALGESIDEAVGIPIVNEVELEVLV